MDDEFRFPDEEYSVSSRRTASRKDRSRSGRSLRRQSSSRSLHSIHSNRSGGKNPRNQSSASVSAVPTVSRHDHERQRMGNESRRSRGTKSFSILTRKLESGYHLTWINGGSKKQIVTLSTNSDKSYLRVRMRRDEDESENDASKVNRRDIKIKVRHIAKIGSDKESTSEKRRDDDHNPSKRSQIKGFFIKIKSSAGEFNKFKFLAESPAERDSVLLAIRSLIDHGKNLKGHQERHVQGSHPSSSQTTEYEMRSNEKFFKALKITDHRNEMTEEDADSLSIPVPNNLVNPVDDEEFFDSRDEFFDSREDNGFRRTEDSERDAADTFDRSKEKDSFQRENGHGKAYDSSRSNSANTMSSRNRPSAWMKKKHVDNDDITARKSIAAHGKNRQHQSTLRANHNKERARPHRRPEHQRNLADIDGSKSSMSESKSSMSESKSSMSEIADPMVHDSCQAQALSTLADGFGADFTNPVVGPWCTDDICTAGLKEFADSMTGIFDLKDNRNVKGVSADKKNQRVIAEEYMSGFLSSNTNMSELLSVKDLWNVAAMKHATGKEIKNTRIHNRARNSNGKAMRLKNLRKQMTFEGADTKNTAILQTVSSFDGVNRKSEGDMDDSDLLYYDSDPEDARERILTDGPRVAIARRKAASNKSIGKRREALDILDTGRFGLGRKWKRLGQDVLSDIIEATKNEKLNLIWHPTQNNKNNSMSPVCVKVWVECGVYLNDGSFLLPKLTWLPAHEQNLESRVLNVSDNIPGSIELLDVCRVRECESIDRTLHPFAHVDRSFIIQTQSGRYLFEAQSKQERGRVVNGLKLVIARLASLLMLKDLRAVDEFFGGNAVPGEAPIWARDCENTESDGAFPR